MAVLAPTGLAATPGNSQVLLVWDSVIDAITYSVERDSSPIATVGATPDSPQEAFLDTGLANGVEFSYTVSVTTSAGTSAVSAAVLVTPLTILIIEDGTGVVGANVYESLADTLSRLSKFGYSELSDQNVFQENIMVRATASIDRSVRSTTFLCPIRLDQGLYYPRSEGFSTISETLLTSVIAVPDNVLLASALKAEYIALDEYDLTNPYIDIPSSIQQVELAKGVHVRKFEGPTVLPKLRNVGTQISSLLRDLSRETPIFVGGP